MPPCFTLFNAQSTTPLYTPGLAACIRVLTMSNGNPMYTHINAPPKPLMTSLKDSIRLGQDETRAKRHFELWTSEIYGNCTGRVGCVQYASSRSGISMLTWAPCLMPVLLSCSHESHAISIILKLQMGPPASSVRPELPWITTQATTRHLPRGRCWPFGAQNPSPRYTDSIFWIQDFRTGGIMAV